jgi:adenosylcobyric acid synthase
MAALRPLMVLGCTSGAGKSLLATGLARWFARQGVDIVPFKAQNMSNNARVVDGGEIGVAQWLQAGAARVEPDVRMNPVLLKPEGETRSQVVLCGRARHDLTNMPWADRAAHLWPAVVEAFDGLRQTHELVIIEGAGSPAEVNLYPDVPNIRTLRHSRAAALLTADIDRGGAFAHLVGTVSLMPDDTRGQVTALVLNKFRGDPDLLAPAPAIVEQRTGMRGLGIVPMLDHELPDEEGATVRAAPPDPAAPRVMVVRYPFASNLDELHLLARAAHVELVDRAAALSSADLVVLPGSKHIAADRAWLAARGFDQALHDAHRRGARLLGICGGAMLLGGRVIDDYGVEGGATEGLGLLPLTITMGPEKIVERTTVSFARLPWAWQALDGKSVAGYEIRHGRVESELEATGDARVWADGTILATTVHGVLEDSEIVAALVGSRPDPVLETTFERLADVVDTHLDTGRLWEMVGG